MPTISGLKLTLAASIPWNAVFPARAVDEPPLRDKIIPEFLFHSAPRLRP
jgi:hypothetical protein